MVHKIINSSQFIKYESDSLTHQRADSST